MGVAPKLRAADTTHVGVVRAHGDVEPLAVPNHLNNGAFRRQCALERLALSEIDDGIDGLPYGLGESRVESYGLVRCANPVARLSEIGPWACNGDLRAEWHSAQCLNGEPTANHAHARRNLRVTASARRSGARDAH